MHEMFSMIGEAAVSAIMGELASRSVSFLIQACSERMAPTTEDEVRLLGSLQRLLLRVGAAVEDAEGRLITSQATLQQLSTLRQAMQRGHLTLDTFRCRLHYQPADPGGHSFFALSISNPAKRLCAFDGGSRESTAELRRVLVSLEAAVEDAAEFVLLSAGYPRLARQPYSMHLLLDRCMFGRQMEMERVINFLLAGAQDPSAEPLGVLPIVGPGNVGKSTLVEHACIDERVRDHFSQILLLDRHDLKSQSLELGAGVVKKHDNRAASGGGRVLVIVELDRDMDEDSWLRLYSASKTRFIHGSKIIVTSRSDKIARFGTTPPLRLQFLTQEAYWYYFKVRTFGSVDVAKEHPKLASIAMEMASEMSGCFMGIAIFGRMLRSKFDASSWSLALAVYREFRRRNRDFCEGNPFDPWRWTKPILVPTVNRASPGSFFVAVENYQTATPAQKGGSAAAPEVKLLDIMLGSATPRGEFPALAWRSHLPPHYSYMLRCEERMPNVRAVSRKKRTRREVSV